MNNSDLDIIIITGSEGKIGSSLVSYFTHKLKKYQILTVDKKNGIDLSQEKDVKVWIKSISDHQLMKVRGLILAHGQPDLSSQLNQTQLKDFSVSQFEDMIKSNLNSHFILVKYLQESCPFLSDIIFIGSIFGSVVPRHDGYQGKLKNPAYPTSKFGSVGLMKYFAEILGPHDIKVNMISPGPVRESLTPDDEYWLNFKKRLPLAKPATLAEINLTVAFLLHAISITGQNIIIDGGYTLT